MEHLVFSTAAVPAREQFAYWSESFRRAVFGLSSEPLGDTVRGFRGRAEAWITPSIERFQCSAENLMVDRGPREIARQHRDSIWIYQERGAPACFEQGGREFPAAAGDLIVTDANQSFGIRAHHDYCHDIWMLPRELLAPHLPPQLGPLWVPQKGKAGIGAIFGAYLESLRQEMNALPSAQLDAVADHLARFVAIMCGAPQAEHRQTLRTAFLERAKQHIDRHIADPDLAPATAAAALGVSLRTLHLAFEPSGESFAELVMRRRLVECRAALTNPATPDRSVADIAFGWGFQSLATFYRAFREEYGMAPGDAREVGRSRR